MIRSEELANEATSAYTGGKGFLYDHVSRFIVKPIDKTRQLINIKVDSQRRSMKEFSSCSWSLTLRGKRFRKIHLS